ncbi:hypothetical protein Dfri01_47000 [Dyadobacter frigoris]|nr:hypothetical protein Dfri01_47000 [Dyadobacter frigoris]
MKTFLIDKSSKCSLINLSTPVLPVRENDRLNEISIMFYLIRDVCVFIVSSCCLQNQISCFNSENEFCKIIDV